MSAQFGVDSLSHFSFRVWTDRHSAVYYNSDWVKVQRPTRHWKSHIGDAIPSQSVCQYWENKIKTRRNNRRYINT